MPSSTDHHHHHTRTDADADDAMPDAPAAHAVPDAPSASTTAPSREPDAIPEVQVRVVEATPPVHEPAPSPALVPASPSITPIHTEPGPALMQPDPAPSSRGSTPPPPPPPNTDKPHSPQPTPRASYVAHPPVASTSYTVAPHTPPLTTAARTQPPLSRHGSPSRSSTLSVDPSSPRRRSTLPPPQPILLPPEPAHTGLPPPPSSTPSYYNYNTGPYDPADRLARGLGRLERTLSDAVPDVTQQIRMQSRGVTELVGHEVRGIAQQTRGLLDHAQGEIQRGRGALEQEMQAGRGAIERAVEQVREAAEGGVGRMVSNGARRATDYFVQAPLSPTGTGTGPMSEWRRSAMTGTTTKSLTIAQRLEPTLEFAQRERAKYARKARLTGMALNVAIGSQVVLGALTTGLAAATTGRTTSVVVSVFGGASTCVATYLARVRGSGEPETSKQRVRDLDHFVREVQALMLDKGYILSRVDDHGEHIRDHYDDVIDDLRRRFEELIGNNIDNGTPEKSRMPMKTSV